MSGRKSIIRYETQSGVMLEITPLNLGTLRAIMLKAEEVHPFPDKAPYETPLENAFVEGQKDSAENNPEYVKRCLEIASERRQWVDKAVFLYAVRFADYPDTKALVESFAQQLANLREIAVLPEDDFEATLHHLVLTWNQPTYNRAQKGWEVADSEYAKVIKIAIQTVALTPDEITEGVRFFRPVLRDDTAGKVAG